VIFVIPCVPNDYAHWTQITALDGEVFGLTFDWNQRDGHWRLSLADADGAAIVSGVTLTSGGEPLQSVAGVNRPLGELICYDTEQREDVDPGFADLGARFLLVYLDAEELGR